MLPAKEQRQEMENVLLSYDANKEHFEMMLMNMAELFFKRFTTLQKAGFTEQQAFEIVKARGLE